MDQPFTLGDAKCDLDIFTDVRIAPGKNPLMVQRELAAAIGNVNLDCQISFVPVSSRAHRSMPGL